MSKSQLLKQFSSFLPKHAVLSEHEQLKPYECDALTAYRRLPMIVVLPETETQVRQILEACYELRVPVIARGAGTGLSGGALPAEDAVLISLAKLMHVLSVDPLARTARVQPGVRNLAITEAAKPHSLYYAPDPSSQIACTIGGNVAENSGGVHCLKYGLTLHNILRVRLLLITGEVIEIGSHALDAAGYDLLALITGSEGMLGIITEVTVKLLPKPQCTVAIMGVFMEVEHAALAVSEVIGAGIIPAGFEMMDALAIQAAEQYAHAGYPLYAKAILLCEIDGLTEEVQEQVLQAESMMLKCGATAIHMAQSDAERVRLWAGRKGAFPAVGRLAPDYYCMDGTIPRKYLPYVLQRISVLSQQFGLRVANVFHAGDGNLHPLILFDASNPGELQRTEELGGEILELCVAVGGTVTGEHGVGVEKLNQMCVQFGEEELKIFHAVKEAFDEHKLLNPGKAIPTLNRCAEFGAMRVHNNEMKFPDLPRF